MEFLGEAWVYSDLFQGWFEDCSHFPLWAQDPGDKRALIQWWIRRSHQSLIVTCSILLSPQLGEVELVPDSQRVCAAANQSSLGRGWSGLCWSDSNPGKGQLLAGSVYLVLAAWYTSFLCFSFLEVSWNDLHPYTIIKIFIVIAFHIFVLSSSSNFDCSLLLIWFNLWWFCCIKSHE